MAVSRFQFRIWLLLKLVVLFAMLAALLRTDLDLLGNMIATSVAAPSFSA